MFANNGTATQHHAHINHGAFADNRADINNRAHHDDGIIANLNLVTNNGTRLNASVDFLHIEHGHSGIAAIILDFVVIECVGVGFEHGGLMSAQSPNTILPLRPPNTLHFALRSAGLIVNLLARLLAYIHLHRSFFFSDVAMKLMISSAFMLIPLTLVRRFRRGAAAPRNHSGLPFTSVHYAPA